MLLTCSILSDAVRIVFCFKTEPVGATVPQRKAASISLIR